MRSFWISKFLLLCLSLLLPDDACAWARITDNIMGRTIQEVAGPPTDGQILIYDATTDTWAYGTGGGAGGSGLVLQNQGVTLGTTVSTVNLSTHFLATQQGTYGAVLLLATDSVTADILGTGAVTSTKILDGTITALDCTADVSDRLLPPGGVAWDITYSDGTNWKRLAKGPDTNVLTMVGGAVAWAAAGAGTFSGDVDSTTAGYFYDDGASGKVTIHDNDGFRIEDAAASGVTFVPGAGNAATLTGILNATSLRPGTSNSAVLITDASGNIAGSTALNFAVLSGQRRLNVGITPNRVQIGQGSIFIDGATEGVTLTAVNSTMDVAGSVRSTVGMETVNATVTAMSTVGGVWYSTTGGVLAQTAVGTATHVLTSNGAGNAPTFQAAGAGSAFSGDMDSATQKFLNNTNSSTPSVVVQDTDGVNIRNMLGTNSVTLTAGGTNQLWTTSDVSTSQRVLVGDGTAALPSLTFGKDPTTGFSRVSSYVTAFSLAEKQVLRWDSSGRIIMKRYGAAVADPGVITAALNINATLNSGGVYVQDTGTGNAASFLANSADGNMQMVASGSAAAYPYNRDYIYTDDVDGMLIHSNNAASLISMRVGTVPSMQLDTSGVSVTANVTITASSTGPGITPLLVQKSDGTDVFSVRASGAQLNRISGADQIASASTTDTVTLPDTMPDATYHVSLTSVDAALGLPTDIHVTARTTTSFTITYAVTGATIDYSYGVTDY